MGYGCVAIGTCLIWLTIVFVDCMGGPRHPVWEGSNTSEVCLSYFDYDCDLDVDLADFAVFQNDVP